MVRIKPLFLLVIFLLTALAAAAGEEPAPLLRNRIKIDTDGKLKYQRRLGAHWFIGPEVGYHLDYIFNERGLFSIEQLPDLWALTLSGEWNIRQFKLEGIGRALNNESIRDFQIEAKLKYEMPLTAHLAFLPNMSLFKFERDEFGFSRNAGKYRLEFNPGIRLEFIAAY